MEWNDVLLSSYEKTKASKIITRAVSEYCVCKKKSALPVSCLARRGPLKVLNDTKLILNESEWPLWSFRINLISHRTFRCPLFYKPETFIGLFLWASFPLAALGKLGYCQVIYLSHKTSWWNKIYSFLSLFLSVCFLLLTMAAT